MSILQYTVSYTLNQQHMMAFQLAIGGLLFQVDYAAVRLNQYEITWNGPFSYNVIIVGC